MQEQLEERDFWSCLSGRDKEKLCNALEGRKDDPGRQRNKELEG